MASDLNYFLVSVVGYSDFDNTRCLLIFGIRHDLKYQANKE